MFLFDLEDFKCVQLPNDWEDYGTSIRGVFYANLRCLRNLINSKQSQFSGGVNDSLTALGYNFNSNGDSYCSVQYSKSLYE